MYTIPILVEYRGITLTGHAYPAEQSETLLSSPLKIFINSWCIGILGRKQDNWAMDHPIDQKFVDALGKCIVSYNNKLLSAMNE